MKWFSKQVVHEFSDLASRGRGFVVGEKRTVHHTALAVDDSAAISITHHQKIFAVVAVLAAAGLLALNFHVVVFTAVIVLTTFYFLDLLFGLFLAYRSFSQNPEISVSKKELAAIDEATLPTYTIFCPLYKEWEVLPQFVKAIQGLDYPKDKLQVMLQLEADDTETVAHARAMDLPAYFEIVVVPDAKPKTKPKAMNYGLQFATGDIITIYDAEDAPEKTQLKKVVVAFAKSPKEVVCVQGKLNFYNPYQNLLTRMFTAEYSLWFDLILPGLQSINAPIPLGGTTNNFKREVLQELAGWDAYNVTEDCDLGMRLAKKGYRTAIVDSTTLEEANSGYHNWYRQRSRWIKGYMQTYLVNMRNVPKAIREFGLRNFLLMQLTVGGKVLSMFVNPFLWLITFAYFAARTQVAPYIEPFFPPAVLYVGVVSLILGNFFYVYAYMIGLAKRKEFRVMKFVFLVPLYWLFMSVAAWKAFYELLVKPHYWQKTHHGLHLAKQHAVALSWLKDALALVVVLPFLYVVVRNMIETVGFGIGGVDFVAATTWVGIICWCVISGFGWNYLYATVYTKLRTQSSPLFLKFVVLLLFALWFAWVFASVLISPWVQALLVRVFTLLFLSNSFVVNSPKTFWALAVLCVLCLFPVVIMKKNSDAL